MGDTEESNGSSQPAEVAMDSNPSEQNAPTPLATQTSRPALDADEMRRRRLAKIGGTTPATQPAKSAVLNPVTDLSQSIIQPVAKLPRNRTEPTQSLRTTSVPKMATPNCEESMLKIARSVCGPSVKFETSMTEDIFSANPASVLGSLILESCQRVYTETSRENDTLKRAAGSSSNVKSYSCLKFLFELHQSAIRKKNQLKGMNADESLKKKIELVAYIEKASLRFSVLVLNNYFAKDADSFCDPCNSVLYHLIVENNSAWDFMVAICSIVKTEFPEQVFTEVFSSLLQTISFKISVDSSVNNPSSSNALDMMCNLLEMQVDVLSEKVVCKPFVELTVKQENWLPAPLTAAEGREIQRLSFLGPFLSVSCLNEDDPLFATSVVPGGLEDFKDLVIFKKIQQIVYQLRTKQHLIVRTLLVNQSTRANTLDLLANFLTRNMKRAQFQPDSSTLATHGFMLNFLYILCELETKVTLDKVDANYLVHPRSRFDLSNESLLRMSSPELAEYRDSIKDDGTAPRFPTECFFFTLYGSHLCFIPVIKHYTNVMRTYKQMKAVLTEAEKQQDRMSNSFVQNRLRELRQQLESYYRSAVTLGAVLAEENLLGLMFHYYSKVMDLILSMVSAPDSSKGLFGQVKTPTLPLAEEVPKSFASFPAFVIEDIADYITYVVRNAPNTVSSDQNSSRSLVNFLVTFACSPNYISNPYLVAKVVEIIFLLNPGNSQSPNTLYQQILDHKEAIDHFAPSLIHFYVAIESTGSSNEFYDKFSIRYHLTIIFMSMWNNPTHKACMVHTLNSGGEIVRFVNLLINDTTFLLDESLECIKRIHETQQLMKNTTEWNKLSKDQQGAKKKKLHEDESQCRSYMTLVNETLNMFHYLTRDVQKPFLLPEIIGRLAAMLNCYLSQLVGPNYKELNIENREKYGFQPKALLDNITDLYLHLDSKELVEAIAADDRSYREEIFVSAEETLRRVGLKTGSELERFRRMASEAKQCYLDNIQMEEDFEDAPDHYRDPITQALMTDPVRLPSGKVMDRSVLSRILLDSAIDPFSRQPLSQDSIEECPELKLEIDNWKKNRVSQK